jgi:hypothetical protein
MTTIDQEPVLPEVVRVPSADDMDLDIFCRHMTARHAESLGGLDELDPDLLESTGLEELYRTFHDKLHYDPLFNFREFDHRHRRPRS